MTSPQTPSKLLLIADPRGSSAETSPTGIRRYRLARLPLLAGEERGDHRERA
jgi:hypothetical protein